MDPNENRTKEKKVPSIRRHLIVRRSTIDTYLSCRGNVIHICSAREEDRIPQIGLTTWTDPNTAKHVGIVRIDTEEKFEELWNTLVKMVEKKEQ